MFYEAGVKRVISASPLSMGVLRTAPGPDWHPASPAMQLAAKEAADLCLAQGSTLEDVALGYGFSSVDRSGQHETSIVVGLS